MLGGRVITVYANATLPWALDIADKGIATALRTNPALAQRTNVALGRVVHPAVAKAFRLRATPLNDIHRPER